MTKKGIYNTLVTQLDKLARHNRQGSFRTKDRYYEAVKRFCAYLAVHYHLQKLENISGKHLVSYVLYLQEQGKSASTIKTDLSAIRFFHDKMSHPRYALPGNEELGVALERRRFGQQDRTWTNSEFGKLIGRAMAEEREDYILALYLARYAGLRIHECFRMDTAAAERALRENALTVKGKGGKIRIVPIEDDRITMMLQRLLEKTERGHKLLVPDGVPTDRAINAMQQFILRHRDAICDPAAPNRRIYLLDGEETPQTQMWMVQFAPMYETLNGKKAYSRMLMRVELPVGSYVIVKMRCDGKPWKECGRLIGREVNVTRMRFAANRCDKFELRLEGKGPCAVLGISREFILGSDVT